MFAAGPWAERHAGTVRTSDVRIGETYVVEVPHRLPRDRYPRPDTHELPAFVRWWRLVMLQGSRFRLTVTDLDRDTKPPMVDGLRVVPRSDVRLDLSVEQVAELGLPPGAYCVRGTLTDIDGEPVELPDVESMRVPARWLYPLDADRPRWSHRDADERPW